MMEVDRNFRREYPGASQATTNPQARIWTMRFSANLCPSMLWLLALALFQVGCIKTEHVVKTHHTIDPIEVNVNVKVQVKRELDDFFDDLDSASTTVK